MRKGTDGFSVLLFDKDSQSLPLVQKSLQENPEFPASVDHAVSVNEILAKLQKRSYDLLLFDAQLENEEEFRLIERVRDLQLKMPFILMTSVKDDATVRRAIQAGVANHIVKGESQFNQLASKLKEFHDQSAKQKRVRLRIPKNFESLTQEVLPFEEEVKAGRGIAIQDELTGLYNHGYFYDRVVREFSQATRYGYPIACLMIDLDNFHLVNEKHGHRTGDQLLQKAASLLFQNCRLSDLVARYGGEEFVVLMPHSDYAGAQELAERLRLKFAEHQFSSDGGEEINMTISTGISAFPDDKIERRGELLTFASQALMRAKTSGRNCTALYKDIMIAMGKELPVLRISEDRILDFQRRMTEISTTARRSTIDASKALIIALEAKDRFTAGHAASCAKYSIQVAQSLGMSLDEAETVEHAALLHDIGKICIPDNILLKDGKLSFAEFESMKQHPYMGYKILKPIKFLHQEAIFVLHHHEWWNGEGYPCKLKGSEIPLGARIISVIDSYDTMRIAGGRYKKTMTTEDAVNELIACSGIQFDPHVVQAFVQVLKERKELLSDEYDKDRLAQAVEAAKTPPA